MYGNEVFWMIIYLFCPRYTIILQQENRINYKYMRKFFAMVALFTMALTASAADEVKETATWTFDEVPANLKIADVRSVNGLYIRAQQGHEATVVASKVKGNLSDGTRYNVKTALKLMANKGFKVSPNTRVDNPAESGTDRCIGIKTATAGKLYLVVRTKTNDATRNIMLYFNGEVVKQLNAQQVTDSADNLTVIEYDAQKGGTFFLGGSAEVLLCYARFVVSNENR